MAPVNPIDKGTGCPKKATINFFGFGPFLAFFDLLMTLTPYKQLIKHFFMLLFLGHPVLVVQARPWLLCCGVFYYGAFIPSKNMVWSRNDILWLLVFGIFVKILIPCFYAFEHFPDMRCFRGFDAGLKLELGLDGCFTSSCSPSDTLMHFSECSCLPLRISLKRESLRC